MKQQRQGSRELYVYLQECRNREKTLVREEGGNNGSGGIACQSERHSRGFNHGWGSGGMRGGQALVVANRLTVVCC